MPPKKLYYVTFANNCMDDVWAFNEREARILAQAEQINAGNSYEVSFVSNEVGEIVYIA